LKISPIKKQIPKKNSYQDYETKIPSLWDFETGVYIIQHGKQISVGNYGHKAILVEANEVDKKGKKESPCEFPYSEKANSGIMENLFEIVPDLRNTKIDLSFDGLMSFTPDGLPLLGEAPEIAGFYVAECIWVTHSIGAAKSLVELIFDGKSKIDISSSDIKRFHNKKNFS